MINIPFENGILTILCHYQYVVLSSDMYNTSLDQSVLQGTQKTKINNNIPSLEVGFGR